MKALIIAGGKGTRLKGAVSEDIPKPMVTIDAKPVLLLQVELLKRYAYTNVLVLTGHLSGVIENYFGDGSRLGVHITYDREPYPLGTAGCIKQAENLVDGDFIVFNGDQVMDFDVARMVEFHQANGAVATLFLHPNDHPYDSDLVDVDESGMVTGIHPKPHPEGAYYRNLVNAGVYIFNRSVLEYLDKGEKADLGKDLLPKLLAGNEKVIGYISTEYVKDMGTPERLQKVTADYRNGRVAGCNLTNRRPAVFLDRDGVINREVNLLSDIGKFELLPGTAEAVRRINNSGYLAVVVTNQPVIARNLIDFDGLRKIHDKMEWQLGEKGCYLDAIYLCPHHPDGGYPEERKEFKIDCDCRKPKPGLVFRAAEEMNIDLARSMIIGDRESDMLAGRNAGIRTVLVKTNGEYWNDGEASADVKCADLNEAVNYLIPESVFCRT